MEVTIEEDLNGFIPLFSAAQFFGIFAVILTFLWCTIFRGGFGWRENLTLQFNWHPFLMIVGLIYLNASAILVYRGFRNNRKSSLKLTHAIIHAVVLICVIISAVAVFDTHNLASPPIANLYSMHSWIGIISVVFYVSQWIIGLITFLYPGLPNRIRSRILPFHVFYGLFIFVLAVAAALSGINEKAIFVLGDRYGDLESEALLLNGIGIVLIIFAGLVVFLTTNIYYKRNPRPEDGMLLNRTTSD